MTTLLTPIIDPARCDGCGLCLEACALGGLVVEGGRALLRTEVECDFCGECEAACPTGAISCYYEIVMGS